MNSTIRRRPFAWLNHPHASTRAMFIVPLCFGLVSLVLGADRNHDLLNYHLYDAFAFLHGRLDQDLAPASFQSYFNPLVDLLYYSMALHWPAWLTGFTMGVLHGLNFVLLLGIARRVLPDLPAEDRNRLPLLLALAGCLTSNFLSELGNSMGDNTTALLEFTALLTVLAGWERLLEGGRRAVGVMLLAGVLAGVGAGLKLTNGSYALALCLGLIVLPCRPWQRIKLGSLFAVGVLLGLALSGGYWYFLLWQHFGDPLYPQYSVLFPNELVHPVGTIDTHWPPKGFTTTLLWPFLFSLEPSRVGQIHLRQILWPLLYVLFLLWGALAVGRRLRPGVDGDRRQLYVIVYVGLGFLLWMEVFGVFRYLVPVEMVAPLVVFLLFRRCFDYPVAHRLAAWCVGVATLVVVAGGTSTWGHEAWKSPMFSADIPPIEHPATTTVIFVSGKIPYAWLAPQFPEDVTFFGLHRAFPDSKLFKARMHSIVTTRGGPVYAVLRAYFASRADTIARQNEWAEMLGLEDGRRGCDFLGWATDHLHLRAQMRDTDATGTRCAFAMLLDDQEDTATEDRTSVAAYAAIFGYYGFRLDPESCQVYMARIGAGSIPYQWCRVEEVQVQSRGPAQRKQKGRN
jgi:hypothetical protein